MPFDSPFTLRSPGESRKGSFRQEPCEISNATFRKYSPQLECNFIHSWMDADSDNPESVSDAESLSGLNPEQRQQHITSLLDKLTPTDTGYAEDIVYTERMPEDQRHPPVTVTVYVFSTSELERIMF